MSIAMTEIWKSFIPYHVAERLLAQPQTNPVGQAQHFNAVVLFTDVTGFTKISEALGQQGKSGTEELTALLNAYFEPMIALIQAYAGIIGKFGGDAMTVIFPADRAPMRAAAQRAARCALEMQARMAHYHSIETLAGTFQLTMKAGLAAGPIYCTTIGDPQTRLEYIIAGSALDRCAEAEHLAQQGQIVIDESVAGQMHGEAQLELVQAGYYRLNAITTQIRQAHLPPLPELSPAALDYLKAYLHPSIAERIAQDQLSFINEHRKVTILFASFQALDYDLDTQVGLSLQTYFDQVIAITRQYDGYLNKIDMGDKGSKYIVLFGAPIAHENDPARAIQCALDLVRHTSLSTRIGINTGFVFCGQVGAASRREYTVMGDAVNLAARLMQAVEPNQILVGLPTRQACAELFEWGPEHALQVKGKDAPVIAATVLNLRRRKAIRLQEPRYALPMVGRQAELDVLQANLTLAAQGHGRIVGITAEAGMGKSRLAAEAIRLASLSDCSILGGECLSHATSTSYFVWRNVLRGLFEIDPQQSPGQQLDQVRRQLQSSDPSLAQRLPLLGLPLNLSIPENELTRALDARLRKELLESFVISIIRQRAGQNPLFILFEDCHWLDPLSNDLLETLGRAIAGLPVMILVVFRPAEHQSIQPHVTHFPHYTEIQLAEFTPQEAEQLIAQKLNQLFGQAQNLPGEFVQRIQERAQGNPFYIDEMINLIHDQGINLGAQEAIQRLDLPDSLHSLIISRIDQLSEQAKTTLKVAAVIGRSFRASWIWGIYPQVGLPKQVLEQLSELSRLDITPLDKPEPELEYLFKHIITREVAYESLAVATRKMLHHQMGLFLESNYADRIERFLDLIAYHFNMSEDQAKQREYLRKAGAAAQAAYAHAAAISYYQQLLPLLQAAERTEVLVEMGKVWQLTGKWNEAELAFKQAFEIAQQAGNQALLAECQQRIGSIYRQRGQNVEALNWLQAARQAFELIQDQRGVGDTVREMGAIYLGQGDNEQALACFRQARQLAAAIHEQGGLYRATSNIGLVFWYQGEYEQALAHFKQARQIALQIGDRLGSSVIVGNMGNVYLDQGDYPQAYTSYKEYFLTAQELGYRQGIAIAVGNLGNVYAEQGAYDAALACYQLNLEIGLELGDQLGISMALWYLGFAFQQRKEYPMAEALLRRAIRLARNIDAPYELCEYLYSYAEVLSAQAGHALSNAACQEALELASEVEHTEIQFKAEILRIRLAVLQTQITPAQAIENLSARLEQAEEQNQRAAIHYWIWQIDPAQEVSRLAAAQEYCDLYSDSANLEYKLRYEALSGEILPDPARLPALPELARQDPDQLAELLAQIDALLEAGGA